MQNVNVEMYTLMNNPLLQRVKLYHADVKNTK